MASKAQIVEYISEKFEAPEGMPVSLAKLDSYKKAELEKFIEEKGEKEKLDEWLAN